MKMFICLILLIVSFKSWSKTATVFEDQFKWNKTSIQVCWGTIEQFISVNHDLGVKIDAQDLISFSHDLQQQVQNKIQTQFTVDRTGIEFIGWTSCALAPEFDIIIYGAYGYKNNKNGPERSLLGSSNIGRAELDLKSLRKGPGFIFLNQMNGPQEKFSTEKLILTALHEFGHAAGLRHEHIRRDAEDDENCTQRAHQYGELDDEPMSSARIIGNYDALSIMNYCYEWYFKNRQGFITQDMIRLSHLDIQTLLCMYAPNKVNPELCKSELMKSNSHENPQ